MSSKDNKADADPKRDKQARLAEALRANLHRRKAQARARDDADEAGGASDPIQDEA